MLDQFYDYLAKNIIKYFKHINLKSGDKFNIQFEKQEEVINLYTALKKASNNNEFIYNTYRTYTISIDDIEVIVSCTDEKTTDDFLIRLRNLVGDKTNIKFKNTAILFIHNTTLDSLIKGTESFQKEGMPFNSKSIVKDIKDNLNLSNIKEEYKYIIDFTLNKMNDNSLFEDNSYIFQYAYILNVLNKGRMDKQDYSEFNLFYDANLLEDKSYKMIMKRLDENSNVFAKIDNIHKYGDLDTDLEKEFDSKGVNILKKDNWKEIDYKEIKLSKERKLEDKVAQFQQITTKDYFTIWDRPEGESKSRQRKRNIIIFNKNKLNCVEFEIKFDTYLSKSSFKLVDKKSSLLDLVVSGKKAEFSINVDTKETTFLKIKYDDEKVKYEFNICIVSCGEEILEDLKSRYKVIVSTNKSGVSSLLVNTDDDKIVLNPKGEYKNNEYITQINNSITLDLDEKKEIFFDVKVEEDEFIRINVDYNGSIINISKEEEKERPLFISGIRTWKLKRENQESFKYYENNKIIQGTKEYFTKEDFKDNLEIEKNIIQNDVMHYEVYGDRFEKVDLKLNYNIQKSYEKLINYYKENELLPSLAYYDENLTNISKDYIKSILDVLSEIKNDEILSKEQRNISKLGTILKLDKDNEILLTPLHPINVSYQLLINDKLNDEEVEENILKLLSSRYLMPYLYKDKDSLYKVIDQNHSPEWTYYVDNKINRYNGSRDYVSKLTREKLDEFISHFSYLFKNLSKSTIKVKLINLGDCKEVLFGIFDYYTKILNKGENINNLVSIDIFIYGEKNNVNVFEEISFYDSYIDIKNEFGINLKVNNYSEEDVLSLFRNRLC